ncbi:glycogen/starch synthase [Shewanella insulae]|uniref:glycogen synthase n=1 Tax=Shewanella insulae TaxID=2681496 RepID=UPI001EFC40F9|nr:glycogen/starch synthase [Shewanella insulae]MCG9711254.1 glycogen/starch synthase [Shewanella insulae]
MSKTKGESAMKRVLMVAAENGALKGAKVGGMADVIRDLPGALYPLGVCSDVIMPSYGFLHRQEGAEPLGELVVDFYGQPHWLTLYRASHPSLPEVNLFWLDHPLFDQGGKIYTPGASDRPFAEDANKFALFCLGVAKAVLSGLMPRPDHLHLHDWHCGVLALLRAFAPEYGALQAIPCVLSIHNLAIQGARPLTQEHSSLQAWLPGLFASLERDALNQVIDPRYPQCFNPLRAAIVLSDRVHLVSPSYAQEVLRPSSPEKGFIGGEGLEADLQQKQQAGALHGILNGCEYPSNKRSGQLSKRQALLRGNTDKLLPLIDRAEQAIGGWLCQTPWVRSVDQQALLTLARLRRLSEFQDAPRLLLTSVGRLTDQKMAILSYRDQQGISTLEHLLKLLAEHAPNGLMAILGSGDQVIEAQLAQLAGRYQNLLFINGFDLPLSDTLYECGNLFIMPSSFEPCGISQMMAMRAGQPCLVHGVGGLKDTVSHGEDGFVFYGDGLAEQSSALLDILAQTLPLVGKETWHGICEKASQKRFSWGASAKRYCQHLYCLPASGALSD